MDHVLDCLSVITMRSTQSKIWSTQSMLWFHSVYVEVHSVYVVISFSLCWSPLSLCCDFTQSMLKSTQSMLCFHPNSLSFGPLSLRYDSNQTLRDVVPSICVVIPLSLHCDTFSLCCDPSLWCGPLSLCVIPLKPDDAVSHSTLFYSFSETHKRCGIIKPRLYAGSTQMSMLLWFLFDLSMMYPAQSRPCCGSTQTRVCSGPQTAIQSTTTQHPNYTACCIVIVLHGKLQSLHPTVIRHRIQPLK
jgi:hypothetical protein